MWRVIMSYLLDCGMNEKARVATHHGIYDSFFSLSITNHIPPSRQGDGDCVGSEWRYSGTESTGHFENYKTVAAQVSWG